VRDTAATEGESGLARRPLSERVRMIRRLLTGLTFDSDEATILTILNASLLAGDHGAVVDGANAWDMLCATDGEEYDSLRAWLRRNYYPTTTASIATTLLHRCLDGETAEWEEEMVADLLLDRADGRALVTELGASYEGGGFAEGLMKLEWQLDGADETRITEAFGQSGLSFGDSAIRDRVSGATDGQIQAIPLNQRVAMVNRLLQGATFDDDESTIVQLLNQSRSAGDQVALIDQVGAHALASDIDGDEWTTVHSFFKTHYYPLTSNGTAFSLIVTCIVGETAEWEEEMVADLIVLRSDGARLITQVGAYFEEGGFDEGLNKLEWQLDGEDESRIAAVYGESSGW
jgi:hypothetical protein